MVLRDFYMVSRKFWMVFARLLMISQKFWMSKTFSWFERPPCGFAENGDCFPRSSWDSVKDLASPAEDDAGLTGISWFFVKMSDGFRNFFMVLQDFLYGFTRLLGGLARLIHGFTRLQCGFAKILDTFARFCIVYPAFLYGFERLFHGFSRLPYGFAKMLDCSRDIWMISWDFFISFREILQGFHDLYFMVLPAYWTFTTCSSWFCEPHGLVSSFFRLVSSPELHVLFRFYLNL